MEFKKRHEAIPRDRIVSPARLFRRHCPILPVTVYAQRHAESIVRFVSVLTIRLRRSAIRLENKTVKTHTERPTVCAYDISYRSVYTNTLFYKRGANAHKKSNLKRRPFFFVRTVRKIVVFAILKHAERSFSTFCSSEHANVFRFLIRFHYFRCYRRNMILHSYDIFRRTIVTISILVLCKHVYLPLAVLHE